MSPFWAGVIATLLAELVVVLAVALMVAVAGRKES